MPFAIGHVHSALRALRFALFLLPPALCSLPSALCHLRCALCPPPAAPGPMLHALCPLPIQESLSPCIKYQPASCGLLFPANAFDGIITTGTESRRWNPISENNDSHGWDSLTETLSVITPRACVRAVTSPTRRLNIPESSSPNKSTMDASSAPCVQTA